MDKSSDQKKVLCCHITYCHSPVQPLRQGVLNTFVCQRFKIQWFPRWARDALSIALERSLKFPFSLKKSKSFNDIIHNKSVNCTKFSIKIHYAASLVFCNICEQRQDQDLGSSINSKQFTACMNLPFRLLHCTMSI